MGADRRLIEDFLPIEQLSEEAVREKSIRPAHISTIHLWWARRPLVAMRAAVYATLENAQSRQDSEAISQFITQLSRYPGSEQVFIAARDRVLKAHKDRTGQTTRPKVLDLFAGGGAIPLEAARLGAEVYSVELNPVAYLIELCTLVFPQKYGSPDDQQVGCSKNLRWSGLPDEARHWGRWVLDRASALIGDLYPDVQMQSRSHASGQLFPENARKLDRREALLPLTYIWTRAVHCKKPGCNAYIPLANQAWLCKKENKSGARFVATKAEWHPKEKRVRFRVFESESIEGLGFNPSEASRSGFAVCLSCHSPIDSEYVKSEGKQNRFKHYMMAVVCEGSSNGGRLYIDPSHSDESLFSAELSARARALATDKGLIIPDEPLEANPRSFDVQHFGFHYWRDVFTPRQLIAMLAFTSGIKCAYQEMTANRYQPDRAKAIATCLSMMLGRLANQCTALCRWQPEFVAGMLGDAGLPMVMDFAEINPLVPSSGGWPNAVKYVCDALEKLVTIPDACTVVRGSALATPWPDQSFDAVLTDPPYYDSRSYSNLSDHFYVWHKRAVGDLYPQDFASQLTPKKVEAIAAAYRHQGSWESANEAYETMMEKAFTEAHRVLKPEAPMVCVYAHKTTAGWTTLINAMRRSGFAVVEAWPVEMERKARRNALETAALASSILLVARRREATNTGSFEKEVKAELDAIVHERIDRLWAMGVQGADLVIATVGAGLRAFTRFGRVEFDNGDEMHPDAFLTEVESAVLNSIFAKLSNELTDDNYSLSGIDASTRFYILWRYAYRWSDLDAGEAITFANGTHVELEGSEGLTSGSRRLLEKRKDKYSLLDYSVRGSDAKLGFPAEDGEPAPIIDILHRILWLMENRPALIPSYIRDAQPNLEQVRLTANALLKPTLRGSELSGVSPSGELASLAKLTSNWRVVAEGTVDTPLFRSASKATQ